MDPGTKCENKILPSTIKTKHLILLLDSETLGSGKFKVYFLC